ncbi:MAG: hypothetical protein WAZ94_10375, partial [Phycisphaerales bacterium]
MAAKRISALAKELGVDSKAIVAKCHAEGISPDVVKGHMSTVSAGLEASIRDWFSGGGATTAVETSQKVDIDQVRKKAPARRKGTKKGDDDHSEHDAPPATEPEVVLIEPPPPTPKPESIAPAPHTPPAPPAPVHKP